MSKKPSKFHGNQVAKNVNLLSGDVTQNAWRKVSKSGNFRNWIDFQKYILSQVNPIHKYTHEI